MSKPILAAMLSCEGLSLTDNEKYLFSKYNPLGISLFTRNIINKEQVKKLIEEIKNTINRDDVLIAVDQEGGRVSRLQHISNSKYVSASALGKNDKIFSKIHAELISSELSELGINVNYSPVIDKNIISQSKVLETRCFSDKPKDIVSHATTMADAYIDMGICPCIKHIPGHFSLDKDPHLDIIETNLSYHEIEENIQYLKNFSHYPMAMTAHIKLNSIDNINPVTTSKNVVTKILREMINFQGLIISDAIDMHAIKGSIAQKFNLSIDAGLDAICYCSGKYQDMHSICSEQRFMSEKSLNRFANIKKIINNKPRHIDIIKSQTLYRETFQDCFNENYSYDATETLHQMQKKGEA